MAADSPSTKDNSLPLVIVNPRSAAGGTRENWAEIASDLRTHFGPFRVAFTEYAGHAVQLAEEAAKKGARFIIACGGDGTVNEVANGIIRSATDAELGVLPSGTGGDFRRTLGLSSSSREAAAELRAGRTVTIDAGKVTYISHANKTENRYFVNISSVGLAASVIKRVKGTEFFDWLPLDRVKGKANFAVSAIQEMLEVEAVPVRVSIDGGDERTIQTICLCVANAQYFGGGMMIAPNAKLSDGFLDIVNVGDMSTARILMNVYSIYRGTHLHLDEVKSTRARSISVSPVTTHSDIAIEIDGEMPGKLPATFEIVADALRVRLPKKRRD